MSEEIHPDTKSLHAALFLLADIRRAVGYPSTKLVRSKMVEHCREIYKRAQSKDCHICNDVRKQLKGLPESKLHGDDGLAAATMRGFDRLSENEDNWQAKYNHLVESLPKSKRPFSDKQAQKVIASQVKRITQLEDDLSRANCELDKLRKQNAWHGSIPSRLLMA